MELVRCLPIDHDEMNTVFVDKLAFSSGHCDI